MKQIIEIEVPEGKKLVLKDNTIVFEDIESQLPKTWEEFCKKMNNKDSYYFNAEFNTITSSKFGPVPVISEFDNKKDVEAFATFSKLLKLRKDWIGDWRPDWTDGSQIKYVIFTENNEICVGTHLHISNSMSFPTEEMRDEFFDCFKNLLEEAKTLL